MNAALKVKTTINCATCMCALPRTKTFKVSARELDAAKAEVAAATALWRASLVGQNCRVCASIIAAVG